MINKDIVTTSDTILLSWYLRIINAVSKPDMDIIESNLNAVDNTWLSSEKIIPLNIAQYISNNFSVILAGLILDIDDCRNIFINALDTEFKINTMDYNERKQVRKNMRIGFTPDKHYMELGVTTFSYTKISEMMNACTDDIKSFDKTSLSHAVDETVANMSEKDKILLGVILSNFTYLIRAFCNNNAFYQNVVKMVNRMK